MKNFFTDTPPPLVFPQNPRKGVSTALSPDGDILPIILCSDFIRKVHKQVKLKGCLWTVATCFRNKRRFRFTIYSELFVKNQEGIE